MSLPVRAFGGLVLAASLVCASSMVSAQDHPNGPPTPAQRQAWEQQRQARLQQFQQARARRIHDILNLRPDQDAALTTLLAALAPPEHRDGQGGPAAGEGKGPDRWAPDHQGPDGGKALTTPERLDKIAARLADGSAKRQAEFQRRAAAIKQFYAVLSPEQQRAFDALPGLVGHDRRGGGDHEWGHEGGDHWGGRQGQPRGPGAAPDPGGPQ